MKACFNNQQPSGKQSEQGNNEVIILGSGVTGSLITAPHTGENHICSFLDTGLKTASKEPFSSRWDFHYKAQDSRQRHQRGSESWRRQE